MALCYLNESGSPAPSLGRGDQSAGFPGVTVMKACGLPGRSIYCSFGQLSSQADDANESGSLDQFTGHVGILLFHLTAADIGPEGGHLVTSLESGIALGALASDICDPGLGHGG